MNFNELPTEIKRLIFNHKREIYKQEKTKRDFDFCINEMNFNIKEYLIYNHNEINEIENEKYEDLILMNEMYFKSKKKEILNLLPSTCNLSLTIFNHLNGLEGTEFNTEIIETIPIKNKKYKIFYVKGVKEITA